MPPRRRPTSIKTGVSLPASRLPLGTPQLAGTPSLTTARRATSRSSSQAHRHTYSNLPVETSRPSSSLATKSDDDSSADVNMAFYDDSHDTDPRSLASAKLEHQSKRIEVDAALTSRPPIEKQRQVSKGKGKVWKPFDFTADIHSSRASSVTPPVNESRVNVFRAPSQTGPLSRSVSRLSQQTFDSVPSENDQRDSSFLESDDFQVFTGRKPRRSAGMHAYEDKADQQQTTVEATFNKREVCNIFGNELPGPSFMDENPGGADGQLQFIQHPNGDVSAHQWSASRYEWENLGQFSNIRKRVEGQLAADRLKGETAWQALQQHTLAYFRIIAKQREASVMGLSFGAKEITAALPDQPPAIVSSQTHGKSDGNVEMPAYPRNNAPIYDSASHTWSSQNQLSGSRAQHQLEQPHNVEQRRTTLDFRLNPALNFTPSSRGMKQEDPFIMDATSSSDYPLSNYHAQAFSSSPHALAPHQASNSGLLSYDHTPAFLTPNYMQHVPGIQDHYFEPNPVLGHNGNLHTRESNAMQPQMQSQSSPYAFNFATPQPTTARFMPTANASEASISTPKQATPLESRTAMRNSVMNLREQAEERTKSQTNIRTVLRDPYSESPKDKNEFSEPPKRQPSPLTIQSIYPASTLHLPGLGYLPQQQQQRVFPMTLAPAVIPRNSTDAINDLRDSSPDREWQRKPAESYNASLTNAYHPGVPSPAKKWDPAKLDEWWWSGTKFARQEEFCEGVMATDNAIGSNHFGSTLTVRPKALGPPGLGNTSKTEPAYSKAATRLLIPVLENLASYVQGPLEKRRDCFSQWSKAPEWAIDRSPNGNDSFFDNKWGAPPARVGRDSRYKRLPNDMMFGSFDGGGGAIGMNSGLDRRFGFAGRY